MSDKLMIRWEEYGHEFFFNARKAGLSGHQLWAILSKLEAMAEVVATAEMECLRQELVQERRKCCV